MHEGLPSCSGNVFVSRTGYSEPDEKLSVFRSCNNPWMQMNVLSGIIDSLRIHVYFIRECVRKSERMNVRCQFIGKNTTKKRKYYEKRFVNLQQWLTGWQSNRPISLIFFPSLCSVYSKFQRYVLTIFTSNNAFKATIYNLLCRIFLYREILNENTQLDL